jgi:inorganic pyrophosphatase
VSSSAELAPITDNAAFWAAADRLIAEHPLVIDRPRGSCHPRYPDFAYPLDYGYLDGTSAMDGGGIDVWRGSGPAEVVGAICTLDLVKRDAEVKLLVGCTDAEIALAAAVYRHDLMQGIVLRRGG